MDALLGKRTRDHSDLDIAIEKKGAQKLRGFLEGQGYKEVRRDNEWNYVLGDGSGREVDVHVFIFDSHDRVIGGIEYPTESLTGKGVVDGQPVRCISAEYMVKFLAPWLSKHPEKYLSDIDLLCKKFPITHPQEFLDYKKSQT